MAQPEPPAPAPPGTARPAVSRHGLTATVEGRQHLVGSYCPGCATHAFPVQAACPRCGAGTGEVALPAAGTIWSWTIQHHAPKPPYRGPDPFEPFAVGYVDLGPLKVESRLEGRPIDGWGIGQAVQLAAGPPDEAGDVWSYRFVAGGEEQP